MNQFAFRFVYTSRTGWGNGSPPPAYHGTAYTSVLGRVENEVAMHTKGYYHSSRLFLRTAFTIECLSLHFSRLSACFASSSFRIAVRCAVFKRVTTVTNPLEQLNIFASF